MSEKRTLSRWLRSAETYTAEEQPLHEDHWREALLADYEHVPVRSAVRASEPSPQVSVALQIQHLPIVAIVAVVFFGLGWLFGSGTAVLQQVSRISPLVWMGCAVAASLGFLSWRGRGLRNWR